MKKQLFAVLPLITIGLAGFSPVHADSTESIVVSSMLQQGKITVKGNVSDI